MAHSAESEPARQAGHAWTVEGGRTESEFELHYKGWCLATVTIAQDIDDPCCVARLIGASPELLTACKAVLENIPGGHSQRPLLIAAIARAEGTDHA